jgi:hypothetical protein
MKIRFASLVLIAAGLGLSATFGSSLSSPLQDPKPGPEHAMLQKMVGTWDAAIFVHDEKGVEQKTKGTMTTTKHSDFHTIETFEGEFMGMKFTGHGVNSYCPVRKQYMTYWTDSLSPTPFPLAGTHDEKTKETTLTGECMGMSGKLEKHRTVTKWKDADHVEFAMFGPGPDGKEVQHLRIEYTRRK